MHMHARMNSYLCSESVSPWVTPAVKWSWMFSLNLVHLVQRKSPMSHDVNAFFPQVSMKSLWIAVQPNASWLLRWVSVLTLTLAPLAAGLLARGRPSCENEESAISAFTSYKSACQEDLCLINCYQFTVHPSVACWVVRRLAFVVWWKYYISSS